MKRLFLLLAMFPACLRASNILLYNPTSATVSNRVTAYMLSQDTGKWTGTANMLINPTMPAGVAINDLKVSGGVVVELTAQEKADIIAALTVEQIAANKAAAKDTFDADFSNGRLLRAIASVIVDQINTLRTQPTTTFSAVTEAQVRTAIRAKLDAQP